MNLLPLLLSFNSLFFNPAPDSVYLFSYTTQSNEGRNGLQFAWSLNQQNWQTIGNDYGFLKCDYGRWGSEKRMIDPFLFRDATGTWHCLWTVNFQDNLFAHAASNNLIDWGRQSYNYVSKELTCGKIEVMPGLAPNSYQIAFLDTKKNNYYRISTSDFKKYNNLTDTKILNSNNNFHIRQATVSINGSSMAGQINKVSWEEVRKLLSEYERKQFLNTLYKENTGQDASRFAGLKRVEITVNAAPEKARPISQMLTGVFFEDINYAADGGLYAELLQNRDFEYQLSDKQYRDSSWNARHSWSSPGSGLEWKIDSAYPMHPNNKHYAQLNILQQGAAFVNAGFDGITVQKDASYDFSLYTRKPGEGKSGTIRVRLVSPTLGILAEALLKTSNSYWKQSAIKLTATQSASDAYLELAPLFKGRFDLDFCSLFPVNTFKNRKNGLRADLAQAIADIHPRFIRFPGGCVAHGDGLQNIYRWKNTIGPLYHRKPDRNIWNYHQSVGLGYFEYLQFCEDIGAQALPVLAAGVPCQNSGSSPNGGGQQGGIPMDQMDEYVQDILDFIEYCNGAPTSKWGKLRADAGHPQPFQLKYIGIGNEDLITDVFEERFTMIYKAVQKAHPEITIIGTVGPFYEGTDYREGWNLANKLSIPIVDEHYYQPPAWFIYNQDFYDSYDRSKSKVYLGEYASHLPGRPNNLETALSEALYMNSLEKNGDIVEMASYAPLLAKEGHTQWNPNLIYFNNNEVKTTVGYEIQKIYGNNTGDAYIPLDIECSSNQDNITKRISVSITRKTDKDEMIVKMVNLLPVPVVVSFNSDKFTGSERTVTITELKGEPTDKNIRPMTHRPQLIGNKIVLKPYSFTMLNSKRFMRY